MEGNCEEEDQKKEKKVEVLGVRRSERRIKADNTEKANKKKQLK